MKHRWVMMAGLAAGCGGEAAPGPQAGAPATAVPAAAAAPTAAATPETVFVPDDPGHQRMLRELAALAERAGDDNVFFAERAVQRRLDDLQRLGDTTTWRQRLDAALGALQMGRERDGIAILAAAREAMQQGRIAADHAAAVSVSFYLAVAWLRLGETQNCCAQASPESCILPLAGKALHTAKEGSQSAQPFLLEVLRNTAPDDYWHLAARWLLNVAHMTLGTHPDGVPEPFRMPAALFRGDGGFPRFPNLAAQLGVDRFGCSGGAIADDFDNDGHLDLMVSDWSPRGELRFYRNQGDGSFADRSAAAGLRGLWGGLNLVPADFDNDGHLDFLVLRGAWLFENGRHPNSLVRNRGDGTFVDVTFASGLGEVHYPTQTAAFADYDRDGDLDLYIGNESTERQRAPSQLFRNDGGRFTDVAKAAGVTNDRFAKAASWGDFDDDGWPDLYVSNIDGDNRLYHNRRDGTFVDVAAAKGVTGPHASFPAWFWDFDNDGALDLFVANYDTGIGHIAAHLLQVPLRHGHPRLYRGDGRGGFAEVAAAMGLGYPSMPMGSNFGDLDNDGFLDVYLGTGDPHYQSLMPNLVYHNQRGRGFRDVTMASGMGHLQKGHGVAIADLDRDGDQDVFAVIGGAYRGDAFHDVLFENPGFGNHWLAVQLVGTRSNRSAIGARLCAVVRDGDGERRVYRHVGSGGSFGGNPLRQTLGLGAAARVERLEIRWPIDGTVQVLEDLPVDAAIRVVEGQPDHQRLDHAPTPFRRR